jgi:hypothetical protein
MCKCQTRWGEASACNLSSVLHSHVNLLPLPLGLTATPFMSTGQALSETETFCSLHARHRENLICFRG